MPTQVCKLFMGKMSEAWHAVSQAERDAVWAKNMETLAASGGKFEIVCDSSWASEQWPFFGVEVYPGIESHQMYAAGQVEMDWFRYARSFSLLGTPIGEITQVEPAAGQVFKAWMMRPAEAGYAVPKAEQDAFLGKVNAALHQVGGKRIVQCDSAWASERWLGWGVEVFPDIRAVQEFSRLLNEFNWLRYVDSFTLLGTRWED
jgi:hypothetical protein